MKHAIKTLALTASLTMAASSQATIVEFQTSHGSFQVNLYDKTTPITVANFLTYVNEEKYTNTVIHRSVANFVVQGGGAKFTGKLPLTAIKVNPAIKNEPVYSNVKGTIAMAKLSGRPNSATNQWFFNLADNSKNFDVQNKGFTAFGQVIGDGMKIVEKMAAVPVCKRTGLPMPAITLAECNDTNFVPGQENFITINKIIIVDSSNATADNLKPKKNTLITTTGGDSDSSGGSTGLLSLLGLALIAGLRRFKLSK